MTAYRITLTPHWEGPPVPNHGVLQRLETDDKDELAGAIETLVYVMNRDGRVPKLEDWEHVETPCRVGRRFGRFKYIVYVSYFEEPGEKGLNAGAGILKVEQVAERPTNP